MFSPLAYITFSNKTYPPPPWGHKLSKAQVVTTQCSNLCLQLVLQCLATKLKKKPKMRVFIIESLNIKTNTPRAFLEFVETRKSFILEARNKFILETRAKFRFRCECDESDHKCELTGGNRTKLNNYNHQWHNQASC